MDPKIVDFLKLYMKIDKKFIAFGDTEISQS